jgi:hypothetical protein
MTKYTVAARRPPMNEKQPTHAIWRGIGCLLMVIVPLVSWLFAVVTVQIAVSQNWPLPYQLMGYPAMPLVLWSAPGLAPVLAFIERQSNLYAVLALTVAYVVVASALISLVYSIIYRFVGPARYGPLDAPPPRVTVGRYKR